jgi:paxillin
MPVPAIPAIVIASTDYDTSPDIIPIVSMPPVVRCSPPVIIEPQSTHPATFTALPSITIGDSDEDETLLPNTGIAFSGLPVIAVSSGDASDDLPVHLSKFSDDMASQNSRAESSLPPTSRMTRIDPSAAIICAGCSNPIIGRIVRAMDQRWHPQCFTCGECGEFLEHVSSYEFNRKPYCHLDYHDVSAFLLAI